MYDIVLHRQPARVQPQRHRLPAALRKQRDIAQLVQRHIAVLVLRPRIAHTGAVIYDVVVPIPAPAVLKVVLIPARERAHQAGAQAPGVHVPVHVLQRADELTVHVREVHRLHVPADSAVPGRQPGVGVKPALRRHCLAPVKPAGEAAIRRQLRQRAYTLTGGNVPALHQCAVLPELHRAHIPARAHLAAADDVHPRRQLHRAAAAGVVVRHLQRRHRRIRRDLAREHVAVAHQLHALPGLAAHTGHARAAVHLYPRQVQQLQRLGIRNCQRLYRRLRQSADRHCYCTLFPRLAQPVQQGAAPVQLRHRERADVRSGACYLALAHAERDVAAERFGRDGWMFIHHVAVISDKKKSELRIEPLVFLAAHFCIFTLTAPGRTHQRSHEYHACHQYYSYLLHIPGSLFIK